MANPFASNVNQGIVDQANQDQVLKAAMAGDPQATAQLEAIIQQNPDLWASVKGQKDYIGDPRYGVTADSYKKTLSRAYLQQKTGNFNSPVYYNPDTGQFHDQQQDSTLFKIAKVAPGIVGGGLAALGAAGIGPAAASQGGAAAVPETLGGAGSAAGSVGPEGVAETIGSSGGVPQALGGVGNASMGGGFGGGLLGPLLNTGLRLGSAVIGANAARSASQQQQQNIQKGLDLQSNLYGQSRAALMPYYQLGAGSLGRLGSFLGTQPAAPIPAGTLGNLGK